MDEEQLAWQHTNECHMLVSSVCNRENSMMYYHSRELPFDLVHFLRPLVDDLLYLLMSLVTACVCVCSFCVYRIVF